MPLPQRPVHSLDDINQRRRDRETINKVLDHTFDDSKVQTPAEIAAGVTPINKAYSPGDIRRYGAVADGATDNSPAIQAAVEQSRRGGGDVVVPAADNFYRCNSAVSVSSGCKISGSGLQPNLKFYGCNGFVLAAGTSFFTISGVALLSANSSGTADPKTHDAISVQGTSGSHCSDIFPKRLYLQGWNRCIDFQYTDNSCIENVHTLNCNVSYRSLGQSVNNAICKSSFKANTGTESVLLEVDSSNVGEGLMISDSLLAEGTYAIRTNNRFLSLGVSNCVVDLITDTAFQLVNCQAFMLANSWVYAANYGARFIALASSEQQAASIDGTRIETTASSSRPISVGSNNAGVTISGGSLICPSTSRCLVVESGAVDVSITGTNLVNADTTPSILVDSVANNFAYEALTGDVSIQYTTFPTIASAAALVIPKVGKVFRVSGTTNITSISASCDYNPNAVTLIFEDVLTFTDGNNLILAGNFVTTANDTITIAPGGGGNWFEACRSVN